MSQTLYRIGNSFDSIRDWRAAERLSQRQAAEILGFSQVLYSRLERGVITLKGPKAKRVAEITGVPLAVIVGAV